MLVSVIETWQSPASPKVFLISPSLGSGPSLFLAFFTEGKNHMDFL